MGRLNAGQLNQRVTLHTDGPGQDDGQGGYLPGATTDLDLYARVRPLSGSETVRLGQQLNSNIYEVTLRNRPGVSAASRLTWKGQTLAVQRVTADENREFLTLYALDSGQ